MVDFVRQLKLLICGSQVNISYEGDSSLIMLIIIANNTVS